MVRRVKKSDIQEQRAAVSTAAWDEANKCAICQVEGTEVGTKTPALKLSAKIVTLECRNPRCRWGATNERWIVQINSDGSIPRLRRGEKVFPRLSNMSREAYDHKMEELETELQLTKRERGSTGGELDPDSYRVFRSEQLDERRQQELRREDE
jgi:hypothetical protein